MSNIAISVQEVDFDLGDELRALRDGRRDIGAIVSFIGLVRDVNEGSAVGTMVLEHYPEMTNKALHQIAGQAMVRWPLQAIRIIHRVGRLQPADQIVLVLTASAHRHAAFESNAFIMDFLKTQAPFWKKESRAEGECWVEARDSDLSAAERWHQIVADGYGNVDHD